MHDGPAARLPIEQVRMRIFWLSDHEALAASGD